jgi:hypothetical protein
VNTKKKKGSLSKAAAYYLRRELAIVATGCGIWLWLKVGDGMEPPSIMALRRFISDRSSSSSLPRFIDEFPFGCGAYPFCIEPAMSPWLEYTSLVEAPFEGGRSLLMTLYTLLEGGPTRGGVL